MQRASGRGPRRPLVIPIFIPHEGCPHDCIFCNQHSISGHLAPPVTAREVGEIIRTWLERSHPDRMGQVQVAFYGGSFSGLPIARQEELLGAVQPFLEEGRVQDIRLSTRPDYIDPERLDLLVRHRVGIIELGAQSCDDRVLRQAGRGHDAAAITLAVGLIKERDLRLGIQLMLGLPGDGCRSLRLTLETIIGLRPDFVRLYPVLVLRDSGLETLYHRGAYRPLSLGRAVVQAAVLKKRFDDEGIQVVRMGLQPTRALEQALVAGPYHPAFGELVDARLMLQRTRRALASVPATERVTLVIAARDVSIFRGQRRTNMLRLQALGLLERFNLHIDPDQPRYTLKVLQENSFGGDWAGDGEPVSEQSL
ncbi:MAG: radical SAM protein [Desulfobulbaceae bacterium]|nr:radical SAM protein [Desulfobulbaceae bacterium]